MFWRQEFLYPNGDCFDWFGIGPLRHNDESVIAVETPFDTGRRSILDLPVAADLHALQEGLDSFKPSREVLGRIAKLYGQIFEHLEKNGHEVQLKTDLCARLWDLYHQIHYEDYAFSYSGALGCSTSYAWGLVHACAQRRALIRSAGLKDDQLAKLVIDEWLLYERLHLPPSADDETQACGILGGRRDNLALWHQAWLPSIYFDQTLGLYRVEGLSITQGLIERCYRNFLPIPWIGFEGLDKSGKDTQADILVKFLEDVLGWQVLPQNFPTNLKIGQMIKAALGGEITFDNRAMQKLFQADRADWRWQAEMGKITEGRACLVTKRHSASGIAYGAEDYASLLRYVVEHFMLGWADLTIFIDVPEDECLRRLKGRPEMYERREKLAGARTNYLALLDILPHFVRLEGMNSDGSPKSPEVIFRETVGILVSQMPAEKLTPKQKEKIVGSLDSWIADNKDRFVV